MKFNIDKMKTFREDDSVINFSVTHLISKGFTETEALQLAFNSEVLDDSEMERIYKSL